MFRSWQAAFLTRPFRTATLPSAACRLTSRELPSAEVSIALARLPGQTAPFLPVSRERRNPRARSLPPKLHKTRPEEARANLGSRSPWLAPPLRRRRRGLHRPRGLRICQWRWRRRHIDGGRHRETKGGHCLLKIVFLRFRDLHLVEVTGALELSNEVRPRVDRPGIALDIQFFALALESCQPQGI